jgi:hypothetical protein
MRGSHLFLAVGVSSVTALWLVSLGQVQNANAQNPVMPSSVEGRKEAFAKLSQDRSSQINSLVLILRGEQIKREAGRNAITQNDPEYYAILMLGQLRAEEAVKPLLDRIDVETIRVVNLSQGVWDREAIRALVAIGKPASKEALEYLARDKSMQRARMYVRVIAEIEGTRLGKEMVRMAADEEKDPAKKARLQAASEFFRDADKPIP